MLELGARFAFVGRQAHLAIGNEDFYLKNMLPNSDCIDFAECFGRIGEIIAKTGSLSSHRWVGGQPIPKLGISVAGYRLPARFPTQGRASMTSGHHGVHRADLRGLPSPSPTSHHHPSWRATLGIVLLVLPMGLPAQTDAQEGGGSPATLPSQVPADTAAKGIYELNIAQLAQVSVAAPSMSIPVTSVTREQSTIGQSPAAVFVITNAMIRRSGATCIPEALRLAPGTDVARINSNTWAISIRGFNGILSRNLLVMIDGRTVYSPVFGGVYWDVQDYVMEDIERIEVIRGPGGTLWGANAVNGVVNVITKNAKDSQGAYVVAGGGTVERSNEAVRYGGKIGDDCYYRVYGKYFDRSPFDDPSQPANDGWNQGRVGFRTDWKPTGSQEDTVTVQGDHYVGTDGTDAVLTYTLPPYQRTVRGQTHNSGQNVLARWRHVIDEETDWTLQTYYDDYVRDTVLLSEKVRTYDVDFLYRLPLGDRHSITWGAGYRQIRDECPTSDAFTLQVIPPQRTTYVASQFVQDEVKLSPDLWTFIIGCKLEQNSYTNFEYEPSARLLYTPDRKHSVWGAVSRAVHTPTELNENVSSTTPAAIPGRFRRTLGSSNLLSESLFAYELGYRAQTTETFSWDIAGFFNVYDNLFAGNTGTPYVEHDPPPDHTIVPNVYANKYPAQSYGVELATNWSVSETWRLYTQYTFFRSFFYYPGSSATGPGGTPSHQIYFMSSWDLRRDVDFDLMARYVDALFGYNVPAYITMDLRLAWRPSKHLELALVGQNLLAADHWEYGFFNFFNAVNNSEATEVPRGVYGTIAWRF